MNWLWKKKKDFRSAVTEYMITKQCLSLICESAKSVYPNEFAGLLRVDEEKTQIITEVVLIPGTISGSQHALYKMHMKPVDFNIKGTVHSHPSGSFYPSDADRHLFQRFGRVHIIVAQPYTFQSWSAYDGNGNAIDVRII